MFDLLNKYIEISKNYANNQPIKDLKITDAEISVLHDLRSLFEYLISYPKDHNFFNMDLIDDILKQNKILQRVFVIGSKDYYNLLKEDEDLKQFVNKNVEYPIKIKPQKKLDSVVDYFIYEKDDNFLYRYVKVVPNDDFQLGINSVSGKIKIKFELPMVLSYEQMQPYAEKYIKKTNQKDCDICAIALKKYANINSILSNKLIPGNMQKKMQYVDSILESGCFEFIDTGKEYVFKDFYNSGDYERNEKIKKYQSGFLVVKKDEIVGLDDVNLAGVLHRIRTLISHSRIYDYKLKNCFTEDCFLGKIFFVDDRAVLIPFVLYNVLVHINYINNNDEDLHRKYVFCPQLNSPIKTEQECKDYLDKCKVINITLKEKLSKEKLDSFMSYCFETFCDENQELKNLKKFLETKFKIISQKINFEVVSFANKNLLLQKLIKNPYFFDEKKGCSLSYEQKSCIEFLVGDFYDFDIVKTNAMLLNGKSNEININSKEMQVITNNLHKKIDSLSKNKKEQAYYGAYKDEIYITMCAFLTFTNLIYNGFDEDLDDKKSTLSDEQMKDLESKLTVELFSGFEYVNKNQKANGPLERVETLKQMKTIISNVRNNIAHFMLRVKFSRSGNPENHYLIFSYPPDANMPNLYTRIKIGDFLKFIMNPVFSKYKAYSENQIITENFDEIMDFVNQKLDEVEQLKNDL